VAIVTFTTDFGYSDGYVGAMKGVILSLAPTVTLVDIAHGVPPQDVTAGAVALAQAASLFPPGTIHVAIVDPGVGSQRAALVVEAAGSLFVGPDNGVLSLAARSPRKAYRIEAPAFRREPVSPTFHGRDIFAPTAGRLASGIGAALAGPAIDNIVELSTPTLRRIEDHIEGTVFHVDRFGNLITSISEEALQSLALTDTDVEVEGDAGKFHPLLGRTFADVEPNQLVAYVGSGGQLEIAVRDGSAAAYTGASRGSRVRLRSRA
jgi:S-adenosylmethionine hydrolase